MARTIVYIIAGAWLGVWAQLAHAATYSYQATTFAWETATTDVVWENTNTNYPNDDDKQVVNIGFTFNFGGVNYTQVRIITNGALHFGADQGFHKDYSNEALPITNNPDGGPGPAAPADRVIAPYWDDLNPSAGGTVRYSTLGSAPNRRFIVSWEGVPHFNFGGNYTFQTILYENGDIKFQYGAGNANGASATIGVEVSDGDYTQYSFNTVTVTNGTAIRFYVPPALAVYGMEQAGWSGAGSVLDSSGNGYNGTPVGGVQPLLPTPATPPGTCRAADVPQNLALATFDAINTGIDVNTTVGNGGTIGFWYKGDTAWNDGVSRMLFDASNDLGGGGADKNFYLVKEGGGRLRFEVEDSNDTNSSARTGGHSFAAGTWVYIAVTWDMAADRTQVYVNGTLEVTSTTNVNGTLGNTDTLYLGDNRSSGIGGAPAYTGNSAHGMLDEVRIYNTVLPAWRIAQDMNTARPCIVKDHYALSHSGTGVNCQAEPVTVTAHDAAHSPIVLTSATTITLSTSTGLGDWSLTTGLGVLNNGAANDGIATYQFGNESAVTLALKHTAPAPSPGVNINVTDGAVTETSGTAIAAEDAGLIFAPSGFRFTDGTNPVAIGTQISAKPSNVVPGAQSLYLQAIRTDTNTGACVGVFPSGTSVNVEMASQCNNPTTCTAAQVSITNNAITTALAGNPNTGVSSYTSVPLLFGANSQAQFSFTYPDAGSISLHARYNIPLQGGGASPDNMLGASNAFVVRPFGFRITDPPSGRTGSGSAVFTTAGTSFNTTLTAVVWEAADDTDNDGVPDNQGALAANAATPNFGQETTPATATLSHALAEPAGGAGGTLSGSTNFSGFVNGAKTQSVAFSEVGIINLLAQTTNYLGSGQNVTAGTNGLTGVGRFTPAYFDVIPTQHGCAGGTFTYSGQPFRVTVLPFNALATPTQTLNYTGALGFSKAVAISDPSGATNCPSNTCFANNTIAASVFSNVAGTVSGGTYPVTNPLGGPNPPMTYTFVAKETPPLAPLTLRAIDTDSVSSQSHVEGSTAIRSGRLHLFNAYGSELVALPMPMRAQYYVDSNTGFVTNTDDACTSVTSLELSNTVAPTPVSGATPLSKTVGTASTTATIGNPTFVAGDAGLSFSAPGPGGDGYVDVDADLGTPIWLKFDWDSDSGTPDSGPTGRATFGLYRGSPRHIYQRERY